MSRNQNRRGCLLAWAASLVLLPAALLLASPGLAQADWEGVVPCSDLEELELNQSVQRQSFDPGDNVGFNLRLPERGIVVVQADASGAAGVEPVLRLNAAGCPSLPLYPAIGALRGPTVDVQWVRAPGVLSFSVAAEDPRQVLGSFTVTVAFLPELEVREALANLFPEHYGAGGRMHATLDRLFSSLTDDDDPDPWDVDILTRPVLEYVCNTAATDDRPNLLPCASTGKPFSGHEFSLFGRINFSHDFDVIGFEITRSMTLEFLGDGRSPDGLTEIVDLAALLFDDRGMLLASSARNAIPGGGELRIVKTLEPGRYFLRLDAPSRRIGDYRLRVQRVERRSLR